MYSASNGAGRIIKALQHRQEEDSGMAKEVKMADIAEKLNVSVVTVSKALSGQKGVGPQMREKIQAMARELGYQAPSHKNEKEKGSYNVGILVSDKYLDKYESFYWQLYQEVATRAGQYQCFTLLELLSLEGEQELQMPRLLAEQKVDGMIIIGLVSERYLTFLEKNAKVPLLYLDFYNKRQQCDAVITDNYYGMYKMTNYLFDMGHTQIAFVGRLLSTSSITDRFFGYSKSLMEHGQSVREDWIVNDRSEDEEQSKEEYQIALPEEMPTAFACNCDLAASKLIKALRRNGHRVPEDISVVGFDNYLFPGLCDIGITTYEVDIKEMAGKSIKHIKHKICGENYKRGLTIVEGHPVYKESVAAHRK